MREYLLRGTACSLIPCFSPFLFSPHLHEEPSSRPTLPKKISHCTLTSLYLPVAQWAPVHRSVYAWFLSPRVLRCHPEVCRYHLSDFSSTTCSPYEFCYAATQPRDAHTRFVSADRAARDFLQGLSFSRPLALLVGFCAFSSFVLISFGAFPPFALSHHLRCGRAARRTSREAK